MNAETARRIIREQLPGYKVATASPTPSDSRNRATPDVSSRPVDVLKRRYLGGAPAKVPAPEAPAKDSGLIKVVPKRAGSAPAQPKMIVVSKGRIVGGQG